MSVIGKQLGHKFRRIWDGMACDRTTLATIENEGNVTRFLFFLPDFSADLLPKGLSPLFHLFSTNVVLFEIKFENFKSQLPFVLIILQNFKSAKKSDDNSTIIEDIESLSF